MPKYAKFLKGEPIRRVKSVNTLYPVARETAEPNKVKSEHLYLASANEIDEKKPELKILPHHLEYAYLHGDKSFPIIILSELSEKEKMLLLQVLEKRFTSSNSDRHDRSRKRNIQLVLMGLLLTDECRLDYATHQLVLKMHDGRNLCNNNTDESWEIIKNLAFYDHECWDETKEFVKPVKAISTPQGVLKTPDRRLLVLEDHINFLLKGSRPTPTSSSACTPQVYVNAVHQNSRPRNQNEPPKLNTFAFRERTGPSPQPQTLETTFEDRIRDCMAAHTERMERFKNAIFKQREGINREEERSNITKVTPDNTEKPTETEAEMRVKEAETKNGSENGRKQIKPQKQRKQWKHRFSALALLSNGYGSMSSWIKG
ncbi:hypothetical protein Tco_0487775 [Tanacetum coccineum]